MEVIKIREEKDNEPTIAPSINNHQELEEDATREEIEDGYLAPATKLYLDSKPDK
jgi:hypothetical protein